MSKLVEALRKSQAFKAIEDKRASAAQSMAEDDESVIVGAISENRENVLEIEPGRDLVPTEEPLRHSLSDLAQRRIIHSGMRDKRTEDAFRDLRTSVIQKTGGGNAVIMVTSVCRRGGASFVSFNLGVTFAMDRTRTAIVMDCNFRRPAEYTDLLPEGALGISDFLSNPGLHADQIIQNCGIPRLRLIPCGESRHDVADLVNTKRAERLIKDLKKRFRERMIIVDSAPVAQSADARVLMEHCDYVLLVVPYGKTDEQEIVSVSKLIPDSKFMGVVFNDEPRLGSSGNSLG